MPLPAISAPVHKLTVERVLSMVEAGALGPDDHVELLDGVLFEMAPQGPSHVVRVTRLRYALMRSYPPDGWVVYEEKPVVATAHSLPEPDLSVFAEHDAPLDRLARAGDAVLVVEISWSSHRVDREKASLYASAGVTTYWNVDLQAQHVVEYTQPGPAGYAHMRTWRSGESVPLPGLAAALPVDEITGAGAA